MGIHRASVEVDWLNTAVVMAFNFNLHWNQVSRIVWWWRLLAALLATASATCASCTYASDVVWRCIVFLGHHWLGVMNQAGLLFVFPCTSFLECMCACSCVLCVALWVSWSFINCATFASTFYVFSYVIAACPVLTSSILRFSTHNRKLQLLLYANVVPSFPWSREFVWKWQRKTEIIWPFSFSQLSPSHQ